MFHPLPIADIRREAADAVSLAFAVPEALRTKFAFVPGQYLTLRAVLDGVEQRRCYSICAGADDGELRVAIRQVAGGAFSTYANTVLRPGDTLDVMPPEGRFGVPIGPGTYLACAAGSGITPVLSVVKTLLHQSPAAQVILLYGNRSTDRIMFREALEDLKDRHLGRLALIHMLSREAQDLGALHGRLDAAKLRALLPSLAAPAAIDHALLCGPGGMIAELSETLQALGVPPGRVHAEHFALDGVPATPHPAAADAPAAATATIIHDGTRRTVPVAEGETVLDAALRAGIDLPWSCRGGMCSTCRARLLEGQVEMARNFALEPWETEAGYVLTCQSRPTTGAVTLDYDQV